MAIISKDIQRAVSILNNEELVAIPTETVYGLAGNIYSKKAITSIFITKQRPLFNPLIVHISSIDDLYNIAEYIPEKAKQLAEAFWPGSLTLILKKKPHIPDLITAGKDTVAVRVPNHSLTIELIKKLDFPLAAPSANPFNRISPTTAEHVEYYFKNDINLILDGGPCITGIESTIVGFENETPIIYRLGSITTEAIEAIVGPIKTQTKAKIPKAPGMLTNHYAPKTQTVLSTSISEDIQKYKGKRVGLLVFSNVPQTAAHYSYIILSKHRNLDEAATNLYSALHQLDQQDLDLIIAERLPNIGLGNSINDRLERAST